jgi:adenylosuccinate lyase
MSRADAYKVAQRNAAKAWDGADYKSSVAEDPDVLARLNPELVEKIFSLEHHLRHAVTL